MAMNPDAITVSTTAPQPIIPTPQIVVQQDDFAFPTRVVLDEKNNPLRSQLMEMQTVARNKAGYLTGKIVKSTLGDPQCSYLFAFPQQKKYGRQWLEHSMTDQMKLAVLT